MKLTLGQAAKHAKKAKGTISNALKNGQLSGEKVIKRGKEAWQIDASELQRWVDSNTPKTIHESHTTTTTEIDQKPIENSVLQAKIEASEQRFEDAQKNIEDLRKRLDAEGEERRATQARLEDYTSKGFFKRLFG